MRVRNIITMILLSPLLAVAQAAANQGDMAADLRDFVEIPAVSGYEQQLAGVIAGKLKAYSPVVDNQGNVTVTVGKGAPHRLIVTPLDEPGYVASGLTSDGYLTVQRLPQTGNLPLFNELYSAQPVKIGTRQHVWINGAVAGLSVHLQPQRQHAPSSSDLDNMYIDVGATDAAQARAGGADVLSPIAIERHLYQMGYGEWTAPAIGDRFGAAVLVEVLRELDTKKIVGSVTFAFVSQQWLGARGLQRVMYENHPDEVIYVGRRMRAPTFGTQRESPLFQHRAGDGVIIAGDTAQDNAGSIAAEFTKLAGEHNIKIVSDYSAPLLPRGGYMLQPKLPERTIHLSVATNLPSTPAEVLQADDVASLANLIGSYLGSNVRLHQQDPVATLQEPRVPTRPATAPSTENVLRSLVEAYGVSEHEQNVRSVVAALLPSWAKPTTDEGGNVVLHVPSAIASPKQRLVFVAHMDEIGYEVHSVLPDGRLELKDEGGGMLAYFLGHPALVHSSNGMHAGVLELPDGWDKSDFQWPRGRDVTLRMDVGAHSPEQVAQLGINSGDFVTIPKAYHRLLGTRTSARALDDRVGCSALVKAVWALSSPSGTPKTADIDITFVWSTREELGLFGAAAYAKEVASTGKVPTFVFAIDTFVSADSPLESKRFGDAVLGRGFVVRAVDNSNIVPQKFVDRVLDIARSHSILVQYGVTGGGNDGAAFLLYGTTDVALGWPLRYSHSPAEVIDVRDVESLSKIIAALALAW